MNNKSFTLIELVVAIVIILIIATMGTMTQMSSYNSLKLDAAAQKIASDIRAAQELVMDHSLLAAFGTQGASRIFVDFGIDHCATNSYCIRNETGQIITDPITNQPWQVNINTEFKGISISDINLHTAGYTTLFFASPLGEIRLCWWSAGACQWEEDIVSTGTVTLRDTRGRTKIVRIAGNVGRVTIE